MSSYYEDKLYKLEKKTDVLYRMIKDLESKIVELSKVQSQCTCCKSKLEEPRSSDSD